MSEFTFNNNRQNIPEEIKLCKWDKEYCGIIVRTEHDLCCHHRKEDFSRVKREKRREINRLKMENERIRQNISFIKIGVEEYLENKNYDNLIMNWNIESNKYLYQNLDNSQKLEELEKLETRISYFQQYIKELEKLKELLQ